MRSSRARRVAVVAFAGSAVLVALLLGDSARASRAAPAAPRLRVSARLAARSTVPGGAAEVVVALANSGASATPAGEPLALTFTAPDGLRFVAATDLRKLRGLGGGAGRAAGWSCHAAGAGSTTCTEAAPLPASSTLGLLVRFDVAGSARPGRLRVGVRGGGALAGADTVAAVPVAAGAPSPSLFAEVGGTTDLQASERAVETVDVVNAGSGPASGRPSLRLSNLLPASVVGDWSASGSGWTCTGARGTPPTCTTSATVPVGGVAPRLTIRYGLDPGRVAALHLATGGKPAVQRWTVSVTGNGGTQPVSIQSPAQISVAAPPGALLVPTAVAAHGIQELLPGAQTSVRVTLANIGGAATTGVALNGTIPAATALLGAAGAVPWRCTTQTTATAATDQFTCVPSVQLVVGAHRTTSVTLVLKASPDAKPVRGAVTLTALAENTIVSAGLRTTSLPLVILEGNAGFPALTLLRATGNRALTTAADGAPTTVLTGRPFTERLDVRDAGGAPIAAGSRAELVQPLGPGVTAQLLRVPAGWRCSTRAGLTCTVLFGAALLPAASLEGPTVALTSSQPGVRRWTATVRLAQPGAPRATSLPVLVSVTHGDVRLVPNFSVVRLPTAGGVGRFGLSVRNEGTGPTAEPVQVGVHLPAGARLDKLDAPGWSCVTAATTARCTSGAPAEPGRRLPRLHLVVGFGAHTAARTLTLSAHASVGSRPAPASARALLPVVPRHGIHAAIRAPDKVAFADRPIVSANAHLTRTVLTLEGDGSGGSGLGLHYRWTQRCLSSADAAARGSHCASVTPAVDWLGTRSSSVAPTTSDAQFRTPEVTRPTSLVFELTVDDGSATASSFVRIKVVPLPSAGRGFTIRNAHPRKEKPLGPSHERRALPRPAERVHRSSRRTAVAAAPTATDPTTTNADTTPTDTSSTTTDTTPTTTGTDTTTETTSTDTTDTTDTGTTSTETTTTGPALPAVFCTLVRNALASSGSFGASLGGVSLTFRDVTVSGSKCDTSTEVHFSGSSFALHGFLHASGIAGSISANGVTFTSGTVTAPEAWRVSKFTLGDGGLSIPFGGDVALEGTIEGDGFGFVPLPDGWNGSTSLSFSSGSGGTTVSVSASATGPHADASPSSAAPTATVDGSVASDGTFSLAFGIKQIVQLQGHPLDVSGHVQRSEPGGEITASLEGSLPDPFTIVPGLSVRALHVRVEPSADAVKVSGTGTIELTVPNSSVEVAVALNYENPANWSLKAEGGGSASWEPVPGLTVSPQDFKGSIVAKDDKYELTLKVAPGEAWHPSSSVTVSNVELSLSNVCNEAVRACPKDASVFLDLKGDATFALPAVGSVTANLAGSLALPSGEFSVSAKLPSSLDIGAGISINDASVTIEHGLAAISEEPAAESVDGGQFRVDLTGGISVPGIGRLPTVHASFSSRGWAVAVPLGSFSLPGASGDGSKLGNTVLGWASYDTTMTVIDPSTKDTVKIPLSGGAFKLTGDFATPAWLRQTLGLSGDIHGRATGTIDPARDLYSLRMEFSVPGQPYLYGDSGSATSIRLTKTYFEIARQGADFNLALGGAATMAVKGGGSLGDSSVDLGIAISYAATSQTVAGSLTLSSANGWRNAFGARDLTLYDLALAFQFNIPSLTPAVGFGARAVLPPNVRDQLGVVNGARTTLVANLSVTNPCLGVEVDDPTGSGVDVLNIGRGALTAKEFELEIAPTGCTVGQFHYDPGVSLAFDGKIAGLSVAIAAHVGLSPFGFDAMVDLGEFSVGGMTMKQSHVEVSLTAGKVKVVFSGGVEIFGTNVDLEGSLRQEGANVTADFTGTLDQLNLNNVVTAQALRVKTHVETGAKNVFSFEASGKISLLGSSADAKFALSLANGQLNAAKADVVTVVRVGGAAGLLLDGTFKLDYSKAQPLAIDATVKAKAGSFELAGASVTVRSGYLTVAADFSVGTVFTARIEGAAYYGSVPAGTKIQTPSGLVAAQTGDFYLNASNVTLNLGGFSGSGSVAVGRAGGSGFAQLKGSMQITGTGSANSVSVEGSIEGNGNFSLSGTADLNLAGFKPKVTVSVAKTGASVAVTGDASVSVLGSNVAIHGDFSYDRGQYRFRLEGKGRIVAGSYTLTDAKVKLSNFPEDAGFAADVTISAGSTLTASGRLNIEPGGRFSLNVATRVDLKAVKVDGTVSFANTATRCSNLISGSFPFYKINRRCETVDVAPTLRVQATVASAGISFGVDVAVGADGSFDATARSPVSGETTVTTPTVDLLVVKGYGKISYHFELRVSSARSPALAVDAAGSASIEYSYWKVYKWSDWSTLFGVDLELKTDPFSACAATTVAGKRLRVCA